MYKETPVSQNCAEQFSYKLQGMNLVRFNIEFNFDLGKKISFVCQNEDYKALCKVLAYRFEKFEKEQFDERSKHDGMLPDERLHRRLTSKGSIVQRVKHTSLQTDKSITIMISLEENDDDSWKFEVVDSRGIRHWVIHRSTDSREPTNWRPGEYDAYELFHFIGMRYAFGK